MTAAGRILVINPNSNDEVTTGFSEVLDALRLQDGPEIECVTLAEGPFGIETQADVESVTLPLRQIVVDRTDADAFVIACYSDPGITVCREATGKPVFGIQESGVLAALSRGERFGVIALGQQSIKRHLRYIRQLGLETRLAAERPLHLSVAAAEEADAYPRVLEVARELVENDGADVLLLGCAGMTRHRLPLERDLSVPVIDPVQMAVAQALTAVLLNVASS
ncbi:aspartate/glutamate racemase family protein [Anderseniella sp. Alg231-50]|uniref:aspartate/glutamate racemase family protein n=1 Tax=Anderseniella sp. Alg231-50 TaxID=1922226 RepID=UPI000D55879A